MSKTPMWIDTHCHLDAPEFERTLLEVIQSAAKTIQILNNYLGITYGA